MREDFMQRDVQIQRDYQTLAKHRLLWEYIIFVDIFGWFIRGIEKIAHTH